MPHQRRSLRKRKLPADVSSDDWDDEGDSMRTSLQNDFPADDAMQHCMQRKTRTSLQTPQPKSERQQVALFRRLEAVKAGPERPVPLTFGPSTSGKRRGGGKNINWRDRHGETMLHKLVTYGTVEEIEQLIQRGADVNAGDYADWTALHEACLRGLPDAVECLLKAGADVNVAADGGTTPLHDGAISGCLKVVELLLHHGADASRTDKSCKTPLEVSSSDEVKKCLRDHMRRMTESGSAQNPESSENASCSHPKCEVDALPDDDQSRLPSPPQCSTMILPLLESCAVDRPESFSAKKVTFDRSAGDGPFTLYGPYLDAPRSLSDAAGLQKRCRAPSRSSSLTLVVDIFKEQCPVLISPVTTSVTSAAASASSSALTLSSTSVAASPSTSAVALSVKSEARRRVTRSRSRSLMDTTDGVFKAGVVKGVLGTGVFKGDMLNGNGHSVSSGMESERHDSNSLPKNDSSLDHAQDALPCPVTIYEDISDDEDALLPSRSAETSHERSQGELDPRSLCFAMNSDEQNKNSVNSVGIPSSQMPGGLLTGNVSKDNRSTAFGLHSYSQAEPTGHLPAGCFKALKWKTSNCAANAGTGVKERDMVQPGLGGIPGSRDQPEVIASTEKCSAKRKISCASGKAQVFSGHKVLSKDSAGRNPRKVSQFCNELNHGSCVQEDCRIVPDQKNGNIVQKQVNPMKNLLLGDLSPSYQVEPHSLSGRRCDICVPRPDVDTTRESYVVFNCSDPVLTEVNNNSGNGLCILSKFGNNSSQREEATVDRLNRGSDKLKPERRKSAEDQSVAVKKFGRDIVVFLRKAKLDLRSEVKDFGIQNATSMMGEESECSKMSDDNAPAAAATISDQCHNDRRFFTSDVGNQSGTEGLKTVVIKKTWIVLRKSLEKKGSAPCAGSILHNGQKEHVFDWNRSGSNGTFLVNKSTMTAASDWELNESVMEDQSSGEMLGNFMGRAAAETQTNITGEVSPFAVRNIRPKACAFKMGSGDWKTSEHALCSFDQLSGFKKTVNSYNQSAGNVRFNSYPETYKSRTPVFGTEVHNRIPFLPLVASYKKARQPKHGTDSARDTVIMKHDQSRAGNGFAIPAVTYPVVSASEEPPKVKILSVCEKKLLDVCTSASFGAGFEEAESEVSEHKCRPFGRRLKSSTETLTCRKESAACVSGVGKNMSMRKKNGKNDRVGHLEEDVPNELNSVETDCSRLTASMKRAAGFGSGVGSGCGPGKVKQTRIVKERDLLVQTKANVAREGCSGDQLRDGDDVDHSKKTTNYALWHGLCSKTCGALDSVINDEQKLSSAREKPDFPKEFERFLMATREYSIHSSSQEISAPAGLDLPLRNLFIKQEKERLKLKQEQNVRWERLLLTIEAEVIREYVEEEKRLEAFQPVSSCNVLCQQNFCGRSHVNLQETRAQNNLKSRLRGLKEKFLEFETDLRFQLQNEVNVLHTSQVQEWERMLASCQSVNSSHASPQLCVSKVANLRCLVSAFFDKFNLYQ